MKFTIFTIVFISIFSLIFLKEADSSDDYCIKGTYPPRDRALTDVFKLNLDLPPSKRWNQIGILYENKLKEILKLFKSILLTITPHAQEVIHYVDNNFDSLVDLMPHPYNQELRGLAAASKINLGELFFYNIFYEFFTVCTSVVARDDKGHIYHARNLDFGIFMGWDSHQDKWLMSELLRNSSMHIEWIKNGKVLFKSVNFAGFIGVLTGIKPGKFAFTVNERFNIDGGFLGLIKWMLGYRQSSWLSFISRRIMEDCECYQEAKDVLILNELIAPVYFILSGAQPQQACVITRSRLKTLDVWEIGTDGYPFTQYNHNKNNEDNNNLHKKVAGNQNNIENITKMANFKRSLLYISNHSLKPNNNNNTNNNSNNNSNNSTTNSNNSNNYSTNNTNKSLKNPFQMIYFRRTKKDNTFLTLQKQSLSSRPDKNFYVLETNYDHWTNPPFYDDRRTTARNCLNQLTSQGVSFGSLFDLLSTKPMLNKLTVYTSLMHVQSGRLESYMQDCMDPCPPW